LQSEPTGPHEPLQSARELTSLWTVPVKRQLTTDDNANAQTVATRIVAVQDLPKEEIAVIALAYLRLYCCKSAKSTKSARRSATSIRFMLG
jgi:hypothetical protein